MAKAIKQKDINLLVALERGNSSSAEAQKRKRTLLILLVIILLIAVCAGLYIFKLMELQGDKEDVLTYIEDPTVISAYNDAEVKISTVNEMEERAEWLKSVQNTLEGYPAMNSDKFSQIFGYAGSRITISGLEYEMSTGTLTFNASSPSATGVPIFVAQLRMSGIFTDVSYEGYTNTTETESLSTTVNPDGTVTENTNITNKYAFNVSCQVKAGE